MSLFVSTQRLGITERYYRMRDNDILLIVGRFSAQ